MKEAQPSADCEVALGDDHAVDVSKSPLLRPSALLNVMKESKNEEEEEVASVLREGGQAERGNTGSGGSGTMLASLEHMASGLKVDKGAVVRGGETKSLDDLSTTNPTPPSPWKFGATAPAPSSLWKFSRGHLAKRLRTEKAFLSQSSPPSPSLAPLSSKHVLPVHEPQVTSKPALASLSISEPTTPEPLQEKKNISSDDMDISPIATTADVKLSGVGVRITNERTVTATVTMPAMISMSAPVFTPTPPPAPARTQPRTQNISPKACAELVKMLVKPTEERQKFLDSEFKATRALMDQLMATTCKKERKRITNLWKEKIRCAFFSIGLALCVH